MTNEENKIKRGQQVWIRREWQDEGDCNYVWVAVDDEDGGRVKIEPQLGLPINPQQVVEVSMLEVR